MRSRLWPLPIRVANSHGATTPPPRVDVGKNNEIACARSSTGNTSLTVRYADDAADDAKKKIRHHISVCVSALSTPLSNSQPVRNSNAPERQYVPPTMIRRPIVSKY